MIDYGQRIHVNFHELFIHEDMVAEHAGTLESCLFSKQDALSTLKTYN